MEMAAFIVFFRRQGEYFTPCTCDCKKFDVYLEVKYPAASYGIFAPRGIRQMQEKRIPALGSLLAEINHVDDLFMHRRIFVRL